MAGLTYFRWYLDKSKIYEDLLTNEQLGRLIRATMVYARDGTETEVDADILFPYRECKLAVDQCNAAYERKCATNRENGAKGGRAKAAKAKLPGDAVSDSKKTSKAPSGTGYTKTEYFNTVRHLRQGEEIDADDHEALSFYEQLVRDQWTVGKVKIDSLDALTSILLAKFPDLPFYGSQSASWAVYRLFCEQGENGLRLEDEFSDASHVNLDEKYWIIGGTKYTKPVQAAKAFIAERNGQTEESSEC